MSASRLKNYNTSNIEEIEERLKRRKMEKEISNDKYIYCPNYDLFLANIKPVLIKRLTDRLKEQQEKITICANKIIPYIETIRKAHFFDNNEPFTGATSYEVSKMDDIGPYIIKLISEWQGPIISNDYKQEFNVEKFNCHSTNWCDQMASKVEGEFFVMHIKEIKSYIRTCCQQINGISQSFTQDRKGADYIEEKGDIDKDLEAQLENTSQMGDKAEIFINCVWCYFRYELIRNILLNHKSLLKSLNIFQFVDHAIDNNSLRTKLITHCKQLLNDAETQMSAQSVAPMYCNNDDDIVPLTSDTDTGIDSNIWARFMHMHCEVQTENERLREKNRQILYVLKQQVSKVQELEQKLRGTVGEYDIYIDILKQENEILKQENDILADEDAQIAVEIQNDAILNEQDILDIEQIVKDEILHNQSLFSMTETYATDTNNDPNSKILNCPTPPANATPNISTSSTCSGNNNGNNSSQTNRNNNNNNRPPYDGSNHGSSGGGNNNWPNSNGYFGNNNIFLIQQLMAIINKQQTTINAQHNTIIMQQNTIAQAQTTLNVSMQFYKQYLLHKTVTEQPRKSVKNPKKKQCINKSKMKSTLSNQICVRQNDQPDYVPITCDNYNKIYVSEKFANRFRQRVKLIKDVRNFVMSLFEKYPISITNKYDKMMIDYGFVDKVTNAKAYLVLRPANKRQMSRDYEYQVQLFCPHMLIYGLLRNASAFTTENAFIPLNILQLCDHYHAQFTTYCNFSSINSCSLLEATSINSIKDILKTRGKDILENCNWSKMPIICRRNNKTRKNILFTKKQFILDVLQNLRTDNITLIPIIEFCYNKYNVNFAWVVCNVALSLSLHYNQRHAYVKINAIYTDKNYLLQQHYLVSPKLMKDCKCLNECNFTFDDIHIGSPDAWFNRIKQLQKTVANKNDKISELESNASSIPSTTYSLSLSVPMLSSTGTMSSSPLYYSPYPQQFQWSQPSSNSLNGNVTWNQNMYQYPKH